MRTHYRKIMDHSSSLRLRTSFLDSALIFLFLSVGMVLQGQNITGTVTDNQTGDPIIGATILESGTNNGTITDIDGNYSITVSGENSILEFSYLGYQTQTITVGSQTTIDVALSEAATQLDEVVVVGYTRKTKRKVTSSVASIKTEEVEVVPATSLGNALAGRMAGVNIAQSGGRPGRTSDIVVRGATTSGFAGGNAPLYVIDGIPSTKDRFDAMDVSEVESVTVLKDAAAASQYGARAANGVILVETKQGSGRPEINFMSTLGTTEPTMNPEFTTPAQHARLTNASLDFNNADPSDSRYFTNEEINYLENNNYGSFFDQLRQDPILLRNALTIGGSSDRVKYFMSGSLINQTGSMPNLSYNKYNVRANIGVDVTDDLNVGLNINTARDYDDGFHWRFNFGDEDYGDFYRTTLRSGHWTPAQIDGRYVANFNGWNAANLANGGAGIDERWSTNNNILVTANYKVPGIEGLSLGMNYNRNNNRNDRILFRRPMVAYTFATDPNNRFRLTNEILGTRVRNDSGADSDSVLDREDETNNYQFNARIDYSNTFGDHGISLFGVYEQFEQDYQWNTVIGRGVTTELVQTLSGTTQGEQRAFGGLGEDGRQSVIGGFTYDYKGKYLVSSSFRYDGSVRFAEDRRFGFFPSLSLGWVASDEDFFANNLGFLDFFKVRFSIGKTGNDNIGNDGSGNPNFAYIQKYLIETGAVFGVNEAIEPSTDIGALPRPFTTWDSQITTNIGFDLVTLNNRLEANIDYFQNRKRDLFGSRQGFVPESSGLTLLPENYGAIDISGIDIITSYRSKIGDNFRFETGLNFGYAISRFAEIDQPESTRPHLLLEGERTNRVRTYVAEGIIRSQAELDQLPEGFLQLGRAPRVGEILLKDIRGNNTVDPEGNTPDGVVDGNDLEYIEGSFSTPPINYGIRLNLSYKNIYMQAFAQGFAGHQRIVPQSGRLTIGSPGQTSWTTWLDSWTPDNPDASYPAFGGDQGFQTRPSSFFLLDADFLRLKQLNIGYNLPESVANSIGLRGMSIFVNSDNLFMIYSNIDIFDPETSGRGIPVNRAFSLGVNIKI